MSSISLTYAKVAILFPKINPSGMTMASDVASARVFFNFETLGKSFKSTKGRKMRGSGVVGMVVGPTFQHILNIIIISL